MKSRFLCSNLLLFISSLLFPLVSFGSGWEQILVYPNTYAHFITSSGAQLASDYSDEKDGGIIRSSDGGDSWKDCGVEDFWFNKFFETGKYIFAVGSSCRIARSTDDGLTWTLLDYSPIIYQYIPKGDVEGSACYAITELDGIIYIGDFATGIVLQSADFGDSWQFTDMESLKINSDDLYDGELDNVYNLATYNGKVYSFGVYTVHTFDPKEGKWRELGISSNFMAVSTELNGFLVCGRSLPNDSYESPFLLYTDGKSWNTIKRPNTYDNNVRALHAENGVLFAANSGGPLWITSDFGENWSLIGGLPDDFLYPLTLNTDDKYLYTSLYSPIYSEHSSGVWRISKEELGISGVTLPMAESNDIIVRQKAIFSGKVMESAFIYDMSGKTVAEFKNVNVASLESLPHGEYLYSVIIEGKRITGKIVI